KTKQKFPEHAMEAAIDLKLPRVEAFVEPLPELYERLLALTRMTREGLAEMKVLDQPPRQGLENLEKFLGAMRTIAEKELAGKALSDDDRRLICHFADNVEQAVLSDGGTGHPRASAAVAVFRDPIGKQTLYEAVGGVDLGVFVFPQPGGRLLLAA